MKAITLKQPRATLVAEGIKKYEFRSWKYNYRGDILIHAGAGIDFDAMKQVEDLNLKFSIIFLLFFNISYFLVYYDNIFNNYFF